MPTYRRVKTQDRKTVFLNSLTVGDFFIYPDQQSVENPRIYRVYGTYDKYGIPTGEYFTGEVDSGFLFPTPGISLVIRLDITHIDLIQK